MKPDATRNATDHTFKRTYPTLHYPRINQGVFVLCPVRDCHGTRPRNDSKGCSTGFRGTISRKYPDYSGRFSETIALTLLSKADFSR